MTRHIPAPSPANPGGGPLSLRFSLQLGLLALLASAPAVAQKAAAAPQPGVDLGALPVRRLGPAVMGGRVIDIAVREDKPTTYYVATASGGLWKTVNNGTTFTPLFQNEKVTSIGAIAISPKDHNEIWVGTGEANNRNSSSWGNGVYHSSDGGKTFSYKGLPMSLHIGRIAVHPKDPSTVFVAAVGSLWGPNPERGLYRTKDRGKTWQLVLKKDSKTGATEVRIDPQNPDIVYCCMYERQRDGFDGNHPAKRWGPGSGIFKSIDGGTTWKKLTKGLPTVKMGRIVLDIYRKDPTHVYALIETELSGKRPEGAPAATAPQPTASRTLMGITGSDATFGAKLESVTADGPSAQAGLKVGDIVLAIDGKGTPSYEELIAVKDEFDPGQKVKVKVLRERETLDVELTFGRNTQAGGRGRGRRGRTSGFQGELGGQRENVQSRQGPNGFQTGGVYLSKDRGETWERINSLNPRPYYFSVLRVDPSDNNYIYVPGVQFYMSRDGGKTFRRTPLSGVHVDHHTMWINPKDGRYILLGCDGGVNLTMDRCRTWEVFANMDIGQAYHAVADNRRPYWVYAGYQDNGSWGSPSQTQYTEGTMNSDAFKVGGGDGFVCRVDPEDPNVVFSESQGGRISWQNLMTGQRGSVSSRNASMEQTMRDMGAMAGRRGARGAQGPVRLPRQTQGRGTEGRGAQGRETQGRATQGRGTQGRGAQGRGTQGRGTQGRGRQGRRPRSYFNWDTPFFLSKFNSKTIYFAGEYVYKSVNRGRTTKRISEKITTGKTGVSAGMPTASALCESPRRQGVLWVGTDDGKVHVTQDDGGSWTDRSKSVQDMLPNSRPMWVSSVFASNFVDGRAYLAVDGHRSNDRRPYVFVTEDFGAKWKSLAGDLPEHAGSVHEIFEDDKNADLLYLGTEMGCWISMDRGEKWTRLPEPFPTVACRDFDIQKREEHLIIATHGRSVWALDIRPLRALTSSARKEVQLVKPADVLRLARRSRTKSGHRHFAIPNPPTRASIYYWLPGAASETVSVVVRDVLGKELWRTKGKTTAGLHRVDWNLRQARRGRGVAGALRGVAQRFRGRRGRGGASVPAGTYSVTLEHGEKSLATTFKVEDSTIPLDVSWPRQRGIGEGGTYAEQVRQEDQDQEEGRDR